jgi:hypothetical protein
VCVCVNGDLRQHAGGPLSHGGVEVVQEGGPVVMVVLVINGVTKMLQRCHKGVTKVL